MKWRRPWVIWRSWRRRLSRSEIAVRLLGLARSPAPQSQPGLILLQVDGLSYDQFQNALASERMPFLAKLISKQGYRPRPMYSGVPSTTPAVQAELFYGIKLAVPAFSFRDSRSGQVVRMYNPGAAADVEARLAQMGRPLLTGGSAYSDIFKGGADEEEAHFCASALGWGPILRSANPLAILVLILTNLYSLIRALGLIGLEAILAIIDAARGMFSGHKILPELKFIPARVAICVGLRELVTIGVKIDIARGLPVIHANFLGYDEQAHRRGPSSAFAHWTLKGIDDAIARIWRAANGPTAPRKYEIWLYSDHGQSATSSYPAIHGRSIDSAVAEALSATSRPSSSQGRGVQSQRARLIGGDRLQRFLPSHPTEDAGHSVEGFAVTALGPVGLVYSGQSLTPQQRENFAEQLVSGAEIPMVLFADGPERAIAWTGQGRFVLPRDCETVLGQDHPYLHQTAADLVALCHHADAGDLVISGWCKGTESINFAMENGSHGGATPDETSAFALLPGSLQTPQNLRPLILHQLAHRYLGRDLTQDQPERAKVV